MDALRYLTNVLKWLLVIIAALLIAGVAMGYRIYILQSDSMSPKYPKGSVVVLDSNTRAEEIGIDDVVGLMVGDGLVFHRITATPEDLANVDTEADVAENVYRLAGDRDPEHWTEVQIKNSNLLGKLALAIPGLGGVTGLFVHRAWIGWIGAIVIIGAVLVPWKRLKRAEAGNAEKC